jgi:hypothetical protein
MKVHRKWIDKLLDRWVRTPDYRNLAKRCEELAADHSRTCAQWMQACEERMIADDALAKLRGVVKLERDRQTAALFRAQVDLDNALSVVTTMRIDAHTAQRVIAEQGIALKKLKTKTKTKTPAKLAVMLPPAATGAILGPAKPTKKRK